MGYYKYCLVPYCTNTSIKTPEKLFLHVPRIEKTRKKWLLLARRDPNGIRVTSCVYFCEDHFDLERDIENYNQYRLGFSTKLRLVKGVLPSKFYCQQDRRKRLGDCSTPRAAYIKRQKTSLIRECEEAAQSNSKKGSATSNQSVTIMLINWSPLVVVPAQHTSSVCDMITFKQEPVKAEPHMSPKQEIEYVSVKEETPCPQEWEELDGHSTAQDPLSIAEGECCPTEEYLGPSTLTIDKTENEEDDEEQQDQAVIEDEWQDLKHEVLSTSSGSELESSIPVGVKNVSGANDSADLVTKEEESCENKSDFKRRVYRCSVCKETFYKYQDLKKHILMDSHKCRHTCSVCHKIFTLRINLEAHIRLHTGERPYRCEVCNKTFVQSSSLGKHSLTHTDERPYRCGICHKRFKCRSFLKRHYGGHTGDHMYTCDYCGKSFSAPSHLRRHLVVHSDLRPYSCEICKMTFKYYTSLKNHSGKKICQRRSGAAATS